MKKIVSTIIVTCILVVAPLMIAIKGRQEFQKKEQAIFNEVLDGVEVYACGTHPICVRVDIMVESLDYENLEKFEYTQFCELQPGEKTIVSYNRSNYKTCGLVDHHIILRPRIVDITGVLILIGIQFIILIVVEIVNKKIKAKKLEYGIDLYSILFVIEITIWFMIYLVASIIFSPITMTLL